METKRSIPDKDVQHLLRNAVSDESGKRVSISVVSGIREIKKGDDFRESHVCSSGNQTLHGDSEKMGTSKDEMDINTLNSCPTALCKPKKAYNWSQMKQNLITFPSPSSWTSLPNHPPSLLPLSGTVMLLNSLDQLCHALNLSFLSLPSQEDTKPGHPKRELCKACLHFLIALFCATTRMCVIYTQTEPGHPRNCLTPQKPFWEGFMIFLALSCPRLLKARDTGDQCKQTCSLHSLIVST